METLGSGPAYVLHARPYRETSLLVDFLTESGGRIGAVVRGVRGPRSTSRRALLQPLQPLIIELRRRGELAQLANAEPASSALQPKGDALLAALYVNELCQRLIPRDEPIGGLFWRYAACLGALESGAGMGPSLRLFELQLLEALGYAQELDRDARGAAVHSDLHYHYRSGQGIEQSDPSHPAAISGAGLLLLASGEPPPSRDAAALRRMNRQLLEPLLGGRPLRCWGLLDELAGKR